MADAPYIEQAASWSKEMTRMRARGPGDVVNAMRGIERDFGIDYWFIWRLRYRRSQIRDISVSVYLRLRGAYEAECANQRRKLELEAEITAKIAGPDNALVRAAAALVRPKDQS